MKQVSSIEVPVNYKTDEKTFSRYWCTSINLGFYIQARFRIPRLFFVPPHTHTHKCKQDVAFKKPGNALCRSKEAAFCVSTKTQEGGRSRGLARCWRERSVSCIWRTRKTPGMALGLGYDPAPLVFILWSTSYWTFPLKIAAEWGRSGLASSEIIASR